MLWTQLIDSDKPSSNEHLDFVLADTARFVGSQRDRDRGRRVYVHCVAAQQCTPSVALASAALRGHDPDEAARAIKAALPSTRWSGQALGPRAHREGDQMTWTEVFG